MPRCSPRVSGDAEVVWLSSKRQEVAHLIPPLVGTETIKPVARGRATVLKVAPVVLHTDLTFQLPPTQQVAMDVDSHLMGGTYQMN